MTSRFPTEIQEAIIDHIVFPLVDPGSYAIRMRSQSPGPPTPYDLRIAAKCAMVCKTWLPRSRFHLFRSISIEHMFQFRNLCDAFTSTPILRDLVHYLSLSSGCYPDEGGDSFHETAIVVLIPQLSNIHTLRLVGDPTKIHIRQPCSLRPISLGCIALCTSLRKLILHDISFRSASDILRLIACFPKSRLKELECADIRSTPRPINLEGTTEKTMMNGISKRLLLSNLSVCIRSLFSSTCVKIINVLNPWSRCRCLVQVYMVIQAS